MLFIHSLFYSHSFYNILNLSKISSKKNVSSQWGGEGSSKAVEPLQWQVGWAKQGPRREKNVLLMLVRSVHKIGLGLTYEL